jgi:hypothetical protein
MTQGSSEGDGTVADSHKNETRSADFKVNGAIRRNRDLEAEVLEPRLL